MAEERRLQFNPGPLRIVDVRAGEPSGAPWVRHGSPRLPRRAWTDAETRRVIEADPDTTTLVALAEELGRTPEAVRKRRTTMVQLLLDEGGNRDRALAYRADPKAAAGSGDRAAVDRALRELGWYDLPVSEQFRRARNLPPR